MGIFSTSRREARPRDHGHRLAGSRSTSPRARGMPDVIIPKKASANCASCSTKSRDGRGLAFATKIRFGLGNAVLNSKDRRQPSRLQRVIRRQRQCSSSTEKLHGRRRPRRDHRHGEDPRGQISLDRDKVTLSVPAPKTACGRGDGADYGRMGSRSASTPVLMDISRD